MDFDMNSNYIVIFSARAYIFMKSIMYIYLNVSLTIQSEKIVYQQYLKDTLFFFK